MTPGREPSTAAEAAAVESVGAREALEAASGMETTREPLKTSARRRTGDAATRAWMAPPRGRRGPRCRSCRSGASHGPIADARAIGSGRGRGDRLIPRVSPIDQIDSTCGEQHSRGTAADLGSRDCGSTAGSYHPSAPRTRARTPKLVH